MDVVVQTVIKWFKQLSGKEILCIRVLADATVVVTVRRERPDDRKPSFVTHTAWPLVLTRALAEDDNSEECAILCESGARPGVYGLLVKCCAMSLFERS